MSWRLLGAVAGVAAIAVPVLAGQISGRLTEAGQPLREGVGVTVHCGSSASNAATDRFGTYRVFQQQTGECTLVVHYGPRPAAAPVVSYPEPATFNFELVRNSDGSYQLRRR